MRPCVRPDISSVCSKRTGFPVCGSPRAYVNGKSGNTGSFSKKTGSVPELSEIQVNFSASTAPGAVLTACGTVEEKKFYVECLQGEELHFQAAGLLKP